MPESVSGCAPTCYTELLTLIVAINIAIVPTAIDYLSIPASINTALLHRIRFLSLQHRCFDLTGMFRCCDQTGGISHDDTHVRYITLRVRIVSCFPPAELAAAIKCAKTLHTQANEISNFNADDQVLVQACVHLYLF